MHNSDKYASAVVSEKMHNFLLIAFEQYAKRAEQPFPEDSENFIAEQAACQAALAHVALLVRVAERLSRNSGGAPSQDGVDADALLKEARADLARRSIV